MSSLMDNGCLEEEYLSGLQSVKTVRFKDRLWGSAWDQRIVFDLLSSHISNMGILYIK